VQLEYLRRFSIAATKESQREVGVHKEGRQAGRDARIEWLQREFLERLEWRW
jgi:hypothetical protein